MMKRPSPSSWKINRDIDQPEDEFFGLIEDPLDNGDSEAPGAGREAGWRKLIAVFVNSGTSSSDHEEFSEELEELQEQRPASLRPLDDDLEQHMIRLPAGREWDAFLQAEQQSTLFEEVQKAKSRRIKASAWALWISAAIWILIGWKHGQNYLAALTDQSIVGNSWITAHSSAKAAQGVSVVAGILAPIVAFLLTSSGLALLLGGIVERSWARIALALAALASALISLALLGGPAHLQALLVSAALFALIRFFEWLLIRLGVY